MVFWEPYKLLFLYVIIINFITFILFAVDKRNAIKKRQRIRVRTLLGCCFIGGSVGGLLAMYLFRHKTKKWSFTIEVPLMLLIQLAGIFYLVNL